MKIRKGDIAQITFLDHTAGNEHYEFTTYGRVISQNDKAIVICAWTYADTKEPVDHTDSNVIVHTILKVAITKLVKLVPA